MDNPFVHKQGQVFINNGLHSTMLSISRSTVNTSVSYSGLSVKQGLGLNHTSPHMENVLRISVSVSKICSKVSF